MPQSTSITQSISASSLPPPLPIKLPKQTSLGLCNPQGITREEQQQSMKIPTSQQTQFQTLRHAKTQHLPQQQVLRRSESNEVIL